MTRMIVTGATGFLGFQLCQYLLMRGYKVLGLGRNQTAGSALKEIGAEFELIDLSTKARIENWAQADAMVHCAGLSSIWGPDKDFELANITGTANSLMIAKKLNVKDYVFISTPSLYLGFRDRKPISETDPLPPPINAYARTKLAAESLVQQHSDFKTITLRPRGIYGPGDVNLMPRYIRAIKEGPMPLLRGGRTKLDLTFIDDACQAIALALSAPQSLHGRIYNITSGQPLPIRTILEQVAEAAHLKLRWRPLPVWLALTVADLSEWRAGLQKDKPEPRLTRYAISLLGVEQTLDITRAKHELGFAPQFRIEDGLPLSGLDKYFHE